MNPNFALLFQTILFLFYFDGLKAEYGPISEERPYEPENFKNEEVQEITPSETLKDFPEYIPLTSKDLSSDNIANSPTVSNAVQLAVRNRLAITLKKILEELLRLVGDDIEKSRRDAKSLLEEATNDESDFDERKLLDLNYENALIGNRVTPKYAIDDHWLDGAENYQKIGKRYPLDREWIPENPRTKRRRPGVDMVYPRLPRHVLRWMSRKYD